MMIKKVVAKAVYKIPFYIMPFKLTCTPRFYQNYYFLKKSEKWSGDQLRNWQYQKVKKIIKIAAESVPYYQKLFRQIGFEPGDFRSLDDLKLLPRLTKKDIKENLADLLSIKARSRDVRLAQSGGSTGNPISFYLDQRKLEIEFSYYYYIWEKYGYKLGERCVLVKGDKLVNSSANQLHTFDNRYNYLKFDSDYLNRMEYLRYYDAPMRRFNAKVLFGYPSSIYKMAKCYAAAGKRPPFFELIMLSSENTYDEQLDYIREIFQPQRLFFFYGHSEEVLLAFKHFENNYLAFVPQYGFFELLDDQGRAVTKEDALGEIVGTGYAEFMPLIRYSTMDFARATNYYSQDFMKHFTTVKNIEGRLQEFIVTRDHRLVAVATFCCVGKLAEMAGIMEMQYYQETEGELIVWVVPMPQAQLSETDLAHIKNCLEEKLEQTVLVRVKIVREIKRTKASKKLMLVQKLNINNYL